MTMELATVLSALRRCWLPVMIFAVVAAVVTGGVSWLRPRMYVATAQGMVSISDPERRPPYALGEGADYILNRMSSYALLGATTPVLAPVVAELHLDETPLTLTGRVQSRSLSGKAMLEIVVTYNDPSVAAEIASRVMEQLGVVISDLEQGNVLLTRIGPAVASPLSSNREIVTNAAVAGVSGVLFGCLAAVFVEAVADRRRRFKSARE